MSSDVFATHDAVGVDPVDDMTVLVKLRVQALEVFRLKSVLLCPMRSSTETSDNRSELIVELPVRHCQSIRPAEI